MTSDLLRRGYVSAMRLGRRALRGAGLLERLESSDRFWLRHIRSLFAIYDAEDLSRMDLPWWTYKATREVDDHLSRRPNARVFEYGAGASTLWLANRAREVVSVEHDEQFAGLMGELTSGMRNVELITVPPLPRSGGAAHVGSDRRGHRGLDFSDYVETIDRVGGNFDVIVVDGRARVECLRRAVGSLVPDGLIIFDDIRRRRYRSVIAMPGLDVKVSFGLTPTLPFPSSTGLVHLIPELDET